MCFLQVMIHADIPGLSCKDDLQQIPNDMEVAWTQPPHPTIAHNVYDEQI